MNHKPLTSFSPLGRRSPTASVHDVTLYEKIKNKKEWYFKELKDLKAQIEVATSEILDLLGCSVPKTRLIVDENKKIVYVASKKIDGVEPFESFRNSDFSWSNFDSRAYAAYAVGIFCVEDIDTHSNNLLVKTPTNSSVPSSPIKIDHDCGFFSLQLGRHRLSKEMYRTNLVPSRSDIVDFPFINDVNPYNWFLERFPKNKRYLLDEHSFQDYVKYYFIKFICLDEYTLEKVISAHVIPENIDKFLNVLLEKQRILREIILDIGEYREYIANNYDELNKQIKEALSAYNAKKKKNDSRRVVIADCCSELESLKNDATRIDNIHLSLRSIIATGETNALLSRLQSLNVSCSNFLFHILNAADEYRNDDLATIIHSLIKEVEDDEINDTNTLGQTLFSLLANIKDLRVTFMLDQLFQRNADVNYSDELGETALMRAVKNNNYIMVKYLLNLKETDVETLNNRKENALLLSVATGHLEISELLLERTGFLKYFRRYLDLAKKNEAGIEKEMVANLLNRAQELNDKYVIEYIICHYNIPLAWYGDILINCYDNCRIVDSILKAILIKEGSRAKMNMLKSVSAELIRSKRYDKLRSIIASSKISVNNLVELDQYVLKTFTKSAHLEIRLLIYNTCTAADEKLFECMINAQAGSRANMHNQVNRVPGLSSI